jgi:hypothetical protein
MLPVPVGATKVVERLGLVQLVDAGPLLYIIELRDVFAVLHPVPE